MFEQRSRKTFNQFEPIKMKTLYCKDMGMDNCDWVGKAETMDELVAMVKEHLMESHPKKWEQMGDMSDEAIKKMIEHHVKDE